MCVHVPISIRQLNVRRIESTHTAQIHTHTHKHTAFEPRHVCKFCLNRNVFAYKCRTSFMRVRVYMPGVCMQCTLPPTMMLLLKEINIVFPIKCRPFHPSSSFPLRIWHARQRRTRQHCIHTHVRSESCARCAADRPVIQCVCACIGFV